MRSHQGESSFAVIESGGLPRDVVVAGGTFFSAGGEFELAAVDIFVAAGAGGGGFAKDDAAQARGVGSTFVAAVAGQAAMARRSRGSGWRRGRIWRRRSRSDRCGNCGMGPHWPVRSAKLAAVRVLVAGFAGETLEVVGDRGGVRGRFGMAFVACHGLMAPVSGKRVLACAARVNFAGWKRSTVWQESQRAPANCDWCGSWWQSVHTRKDTR